MYERIYKIIQIIKKSNNLQCDISLEFVGTKISVVRYTK